MENKGKTKLQEQIDTLADFLMFNPDKPIVQVHIRFEDGSSGSSLTLNQLKAVLYNCGAYSVQDIIVTVEEQPATSRGYIVYEYKDANGKKFGATANFTDDAQKESIRKEVLSHGHEIISVNFTGIKARVLKEHKFYF